MVENVDYRGWGEDGGRGCRVVGVGEAEVFEVGKDCGMMVGWLESGVVSFPAELARPTVETVGERRIGTAAEDLRQIENKNNMVVRYNEIATADFKEMFCND